MPLILNGKQLSESLVQVLQLKVAAFSSRPKLLILQVGDLETSNKYIKAKKIFAEKVGVLVEHVRYKDSVDNVTTETAEIVSQIKKYNADPSINGLIVQLPIPEHLDRDVILKAIDPHKDVDGLNSDFTPATTRGILTLLENYKIPISGKKVVIVGRSQLVGKPTAEAFTNLGAQVTVCHRQTADLKAETRKADIIIVAAGHPGLITADHVVPGQVIIDVGITIVEGKSVGDVDFANVSPIVSAISPVPGGVGPMTIVSLFQNVLEAYIMASKNRPI